MVAVLMSMPHVCSALQQMQVGKTLFVAPYLHGKSLDQKLHTGQTGQTERRVCMRNCLYVHVPAWVLVIMFVCICGGRDQTEGDVYTCEG